MQTSILPGRISDFLKIGVNAAGRGDLNLLKAVLAEKPKWLTRIGSHGRTMLWEAAYRGRLTVVQYLLDRGADIDARGCHYTPLLVEISPHCAAYVKKHFRVTELLLKRGAQVDAYTASYIGDLDRLEQELHRDPKVVDRPLMQRMPDFAATPLHYAVAGRQPGAVGVLLNAGANAKVHSTSLIRFAINRNSVEMLRMLMQAGADPNAASVVRGDISNPEIVAMLDSAGVDMSVNKVDGGWPPVVYLARGDRGGDIVRITQLLDDGVDVNARNYKGQSALHCAAKAGFVEVVELLLNRGAVVDAQDRDGETPLATTLRSTIKRKDNLRKIVSLLLQKGADPHHQDRLGKSPLSLVARKRDKDTWLSLFG